MAEMPKFLTSPWEMPTTAWYSTANKNFAFLASNGWAGLNAERPLPTTAGHLWYSHLLSC